MSFKLCVIGCGNILERCHGPSYLKYKAENPDFELAACCDIDEDRASRYAKKFGFSRYYTNFHEMLHQIQPDAVCILVNEEYIAEVAIQVMNLGFPVFVEKPPGKNTDETLSLIASAKANGVFHQVGYNRRGIPLLQELKKLLKKQEDIQFIRYELCRIGRCDEDFSDTTIHGIDTVRYLTDADFKKIHFSYQPLSQYGQNVYNIYMDCVMTSGVHAQLCFFPDTGAVLERATVHAANHTWMAHLPIWEFGYDRPGELIHIYNNETLTRLSGASLCNSDQVYMTNGFYYENKVFFDNLRNHQKPLTGFEESLHNMIIKDCISSRKAFFDAEKGHK